MRDYYVKKTPFGICLLPDKIKAMLKFYNTLTKKKQNFKPIAGKKVGLYTCGPTVYDFIHIGNFRTYVFEDLLRRTLKFEGYKVKQVMNITDIEDKIIKRAQIEKKDFREITEKFTDIFLKDAEKLNIKKAEIYPKATEHIKEMIFLIKDLIKKGIAYKGTDGSIFFSIEKFKNYGKLSGLDKQKLKIGARIAADEYNKDEAQDFVLWKAKKEDEPFWQSPWGEGRPGWHIECSAMSMKYLGKAFDIHTGGVDNIFPHHENEIAQSEASTGKRFVNFWLHSEHLLVDNKKMSKSLGNFFTLRDLEEKGFSPLAFRYLCLSAHYKTKINFTWKSLESAEISLKKLFAEFSKFGPKTAKKLSLPAKKYQAEFSESIENDLNSPKALAVIWEIIKDKSLLKEEKKTLFINFDQVLGFDFNTQKTEAKTEIPAKIKQLAEERELSRVNKQFVRSDNLRNEIEALGYKVEDTESGHVVRKINN